jgi:exonuclease SbcD
MKFIHTSDWHLGRLFQNISLLEDQSLVLNQIAEYARQYDIDALIVAGDIFDRSVPPAEAVAVLNSFLELMTLELGIPVIMISGNHDSAKRLGFGAQHMKMTGLHILSELSHVDRPVIIKSTSGEVAFYGIPYHDPIEVRDTFACDVRTHDEAHQFLVNKIVESHHHSIPKVLISHCFIDGAEVSDSERPLSIGGAERVTYQPLMDFDYVALGHLHGPQYRGQEHIRYSGSPLKYSFSEHQHNKSITLVEMDNQGLVSHQPLPLIPKHDLRIIQDELDHILRSAKDDAHHEDYLCIRLTDQHDLLDPLGQLRRYYPNVLQLERMHFNNNSGSQLVADVSLKRTELEVFTDFFEQVTGNALSPEQYTLLNQTILDAKQDGEHAS